MSSCFLGKTAKILGQLVALAVLAIFLPALLSIGFLLRANSNEPVLVTDEVFASSGTRVSIHRFRTTGRGTKAYRVLGRFIRSLGYDDLPALWDVARGHIGLMELYQLVRKQ